MFIEGAKAIFKKIKTPRGTLKDYIYTMNKIFNYFMTTENISGDEEETYKKKIGNFQDTMKSMQTQLTNLQATINNQNNRRIQRSYNNNH